jgi:hypothetical protein
MRATALGALLMLATTPALWAQKDDKDKPAQRSKAAEEVQSLIQEYEQAQQDFFKKYNEAKTAEEKKKLEDEYPKPDKLIARMTELAEQNPKDAGVVPVAMTWSLRGIGDPAVVKKQDKLLDLLQQYHAESDQLTGVVSNLSYCPSEKVAGFLQIVIEKNPKKEIKGLACYGLGLYLKEQAQAAQQIKDQPEAGKQIEQYYGPEYLRRLQALDPGKGLKEAEKRFEEAAEKYADVELYAMHTLGDLATGELFEIRNLAVGHASPDIEDEDLDGKRLKLSDYRGKVVLLDFWGNW